MNKSLRKAVIAGNWKMNKHSVPDNSSHQRDEAACKGR